MGPRGTRGAYRKEERAKLPPQLQKELVEKAAARHGNCQELAKALEIPKSSVHYYRIGRLTIPVSLVESMLREAADPDLERRVRGAIETRDRTWANYYSSGIMREMYRQKVRLPTRDQLEKNDDLRRKAAAIISYVMAEGSVWMQKEKWGEASANITFAEHETDLYEHFRGLVLDVFDYDIGPPQPPGNGALAIRGFIYSRFVAEWLADNCVPHGEKSAQSFGLPYWVKNSTDPGTWSSALQPWCDGEGCVMVSRGGRLLGFVVVQSKHTDLDLDLLPASIINGPNRNAPVGALRKHGVFGIPVADYLKMCCRSQILDEVQCLFNRIGVNPRKRIFSLHLKNDGFWSCIWGLHFTREETMILLQQGLVIQSRKIRRIEASMAVKNNGIFI